MREREKRVEFERQQARKKEKEVRGKTGNEEEERSRQLLRNVDAYRHDPEKPDSQASSQSYYISSSALESNESQKSKAVRG